MLVSRPKASHLSGFFIGAKMYGKLFTSMYDGTLVEDWRALITFQQLIILCDSEGVIDMTPHSISSRTGIPIEHIKAGLEILEKEDKYSRTNRENGKRIVLIDDHRPWGWKIVNHKYYRDLASRTDKREKDRRRISEKRCAAKSSQVIDSIDVSQSVAGSSDKSQMSPIQDTYTDTKKTSSPRNNFSDEDLNLAKYMFGQIKTLMPASKEPNFETWANTIRLMREKDNLELSDIREVFDWANADDFWGLNIRGPDKLRKQYPRLAAQALKINGTSQPDKWV